MAQLLPLSCDSSTAGTGAGAEGHLHQSPSIRNHRLGNPMKATSILASEHVEGQQTNEGNTENIPFYISSHHHR